MPDELNNPLLSPALQVLLGAITIEEAITHVRESAELAAMSDADLETVLAEARNNLEERVPSGSDLVCIELMLTAIHRRLEAIVGGRKTATPETRPTYDHRMAQWLTNAADCQLLKARALLSIPAPERSVQEFLSAEIAARALPDFGSLRLRQVIGAMLGVYACGMIARNPAWLRHADEALTLLSAIPERQQEAASLIAEYKTWYDKALAPLRKPSEPEAKDPKSGPDSYGYQESINQLAQMVQDGRLRFDDAAQALLAEYGNGKLTSNAVYMISLMHRSQAEVAPVAAELRARLNLEVAKQLDGELAEATRAYCAYAVGIAAMEQARTPQPDRNLVKGAYIGDANAFQVARPFLEQALAFFSTQDDSHTRMEASSAAERLVILHRKLHKLDDASRYSAQAISLCRRLVTEEGRVPHLLANLGVAVGNLADIQEQLGDLDTAVDGHYEAFQLFMEAKDLEYAQRALRLLLYLCQQSGHLDEAVAAAEALAPLLEESGDLLSVVTNLTDLAFLIGRVRPEYDTAEMGEHAWRIIEQLDRKNPKAVDADLRVKAALQLVHAHVRRIQLGQSREQSEQRARQAIEFLRPAAAQAGSDDANAAALYEEAALYEVVGDLEAAERVARLVEPLQCAPYLKRRIRSILGSALMKRGRYEDAVAVMKEALETPDSDLLNVALERYRLGKAFLFLDRIAEALHAFAAGAEAFESSRLQLHEEGRMETRAVIDALYEHLILLSSDWDPAGPVRGWEWLQRARGRVLTEALAMVPLSPPSLPPEYAPLLSEESELLAQARATRSRLASSADYSPDRLQEALSERALMPKLNSIWTRLKAVAPQYVELRTGSAAEWADMLALLAEECLVADASG